jgi:hypothetical protein
MALATYVTSPPAGPRAGDGAPVLAQVVAIHDPKTCNPRACVHDVEGFVNATIIRFETNSNRPEWAAIRGDEREELVLEGIALMYHLAARYEPHRGNHAQGGWFSGYAAYFLPKKLGEAWHRLHENHRYTTQPDGTRKWVYLKEASSLDELRTGGPRGAEGRSDRVEATIRPAAQWAPVAETA